MSNSLINTGITGLNAAQNRLKVIGNNISNAYTVGYNRQQILFQQAKGTRSANGFFGNGVSTGSVSRVFNSFVVNQLRNATSQGGAASTYYNELAKVDKLFADNEASISNQIKNIFSNLKELSSSASDTSNRQNLLNSFQSLVNQFNKADSYLKDQISSANAELVGHVDQINSYSQQIALLNEKINKMVGTGDQPNDLLDQRDQLVNELNSIIGVTVTEQNGQYNISIANGLPLVQGSSATSLSVASSAKDASLNAIIYTHPSGEKQELGLPFITSGALNGLLKFRDGPLVEARNQLGLLALNLAHRFNEVHQAGVDLDGNPGEPLFSYGSPSIVNGSANKGDANLAVEYADVSSMKASDYQIQYDGQNWVVTRLSDNSQVKAEMKDGKLTFDGLSVAVQGTPQQGDSFTVKPVVDIASSLKSLISDPNKLAGGIGDDKNGAGDNRNFENLLKIQDEKLIGGQLTLNEAYAGLVSFIGSETSSAKISAVTSENIINQIDQQNQSISGVNVDEEYISMQVYMQYYQANAQIIQTATALFDTILSVVK